jgi:hypothetical protein
MQIFGLMGNGTSSSQLVQSCNVKGSRSSISEKEVYSIKRVF